MGCPWGRTEPDKHNADMQVADPPKGPNGKNMVKNSGKNNDEENPQPVNMNNIEYTIDKQKFQVVDERKS